MNNNNKSGYILPLTMAMMGLFMFLAIYIANKGLVFNAYSTTLIARQKAQFLAYGAIQLAISQLSFTRTEEKKSPTKSPSSPKNKDEAPKDGSTSETEKTDAQKFLETIIPTLNKGQQFKLSVAADGIDGSMGFALGGEEGKININRLFDFEKHAFVGQGNAEQDMRIFFQDFFALLSTHIGVNLFEDFEKFLKARKYPLNDVTELLLIKSFGVFKNRVFYNPFEPQSQSNKKRLVYLTDLFTVASFKKEIEPWLFSESIKEVLKITPNTAQIPYDQLLKNFKEKTNWKTDWNSSLKLLYDKDFAALPPVLVPLLSPSFAPQLFWVVAFGTYAKTTVMLWALLERELSSKGARATIRRIYLL